MKNIDQLALAPTNSSISANSLLDKGTGSREHFHAIPSLPQPGTPSHESRSTKLLSQETAMRLFRLLGCRCIGRPAEMSARVT
jgi:hypothetical protein